MVRGNEHPGLPLFRRKKRTSGGKPGWTKHSREHAMAARGISSRGHMFRANGREMRYQDKTPYDSLEEVFWEGGTEVYYTDPTPIGKEGKTFSWMYSVAWVEPEDASSFQLKLQREALEKIDLDNLERGGTHIHLGNIPQEIPEEIFMVMQGEVWSPLGQANNLIRRKGLSHTSMSVGDIVKMKDERVLVVADVGFLDLHELKKYHGLE